MTLTIHDQIEQGSEEWAAVRRGIVTASVVGRLLSVGALGALDYECPECDAPAESPCISRSRKVPTPIKTPHAIRATVAADRAKDSPPVIEVADNETSRGLVDTLIAERIAGWTEDLPITQDMWRGTLAEPYARDLYSTHYQQAQEVGFMHWQGDGWELGFSPDGLVGMDGLIEIKAPRAKTHVRTVLADEVPAHYMPQIQAGLMVSGRAWCDFVSYCGGLPLYVKRVYPDPMWFDAITAACVAFEEKAAQIVAEYRERTASMPKTERLNFDMEMVI
jgi:hypothetical protein